MEREEFLSKYWNYYLMLEDDFYKTTRFVELNPHNYNTYSVEYAKQYQSICSELDGLCKTICIHYNRNSCSNIKQYAEVILEKYIDIPSKKIIILKNNIKLQPFEEWQIAPEYKSPSWWSEYNKVKHSRIDNFEKANLLNVISALSGLFLLNMYYAKEFGTKDIPDVPDEPSKLFLIKDWKTKCTSVGNGVVFRSI